MLGVADLSGGGGTERFFKDFFELYSEYTERKYELIFFTDRKSFNNLKAVDKKFHVNKITLVNINLWDKLFNRYSRKLINILNSKDVKLLHICLVRPVYLPFLWVLQTRGGQYRPAVAITVVDCSVSHRYFDPVYRLSLSQLKINLIYKIFFKFVRLDGVISWYKLFLDKFSQRNFLYCPVIDKIDHYFVDTKLFKPATIKENTIIYAARLIQQKQPLFFVRAIYELLKKRENALLGWRVLIFGDGNQRKEVIKTISKLNLDGIIELKSNSSLKDEFSLSKLFVSTQDYDNFTSLSMLEAMSAGNAIISRNVGETNKLIEHGCNGYLIDQDTPEAMAEAILKYLDKKEDHEFMAKYSRDIAINKYKPEYFFQDLEKFWNKILLN